MTFDDLVAQTQETLLANKVPPETVKRVIAELRKANEEEKADRAARKGKKSKTQFVVLKTRAEDSEGANGSYLGWVVQVEEGAHPSSVYTRVVAAANSFNGSKRGRRKPVKTLGETLQNVPAKWFKTGNPSEITRVKTKEAVAILTIPSNELPSEQKEKEAA